MYASKQYQRFTWIVLAYNLMVILWGAYVRATGSGAGCGAHWPLCKGEIIPQAPAIQTIIEFSHRLSSGVTLILVTGLMIWTLRSFSKGSLLRWSAVLAFVFTISEALLGAGLVLFSLVATNVSVTRAFAASAHLVNTFIMLAFLSITAWWSSNGVPEKIHLIGYGTWLLVTGMLAIMFLGASGAVTALGDTLFPAGSLQQGFEQDFLPTAHFLLRLRVFHPLIAVASGVYILVVILWLRKRLPTRNGQVVTGILLSFYGIQLGLGIINILLLAPVWMQLIHLLVADLIWISYVLTANLWVSSISFTNSTVNY